MFSIAYYTGKFPLIKALAGKHFYGILQPINKDRGLLWFADGNEFEIALKDAWVLSTKFDSHFVPIDFEPHTLTKLPELPKDLILWARGRSLGWIKKHIKETKYPESMANKVFKFCKALEQEIERTKEPPKPEVVRRLWAEAK